MQECLFCKIVKSEIESVKIWEDEKFLAILDVNPNTRGMTLILTKDHYDSYIFDIPGDVYLQCMSTAKKVSKLLEKGLNVPRVSMVMEGMGINHAHIKLYPLHGIKEKFKEMWAQERVYFEKYEGFISTQLGPEVELEQLKKLAEEIRKKTENIS